jgi:hypothetical protein
MAANDPSSIGESPGLAPLSMQERHVIAGRSTSFNLKVKRFMDLYCCSKIEAALVASCRSATKEILASLLKQAKSLSSQLMEVDMMEGHEIAQLLVEDEEIRRNLSACISDIRTCLDAPSRGTMSFKVHNLPQWPKPRLQAWLARNKVHIQVWGLSPCHQERKPAEETKLGRCV